MPMKTIARLEKELVKVKSKLVNQKEENQRLKKTLFAKGINGLTGGSGNPPSDELQGPTRSKLWSSISHEILTPMDAILGMTDLVLETELSSDQRNYLEMINASADRLFGVVSDIIDYSELVEGKLRRDLVNFDLFEELEYDLWIAKLSCKHKELKFSTSISKGIPNYLKSDPSRLRQVLNNILNNAIKFTQSGEITLKIESGGYDEQGRLLLKFTVKDTGRGVSEELQKNLFHSPVNLGFSDKDDKYSEGGLGLVVSAKLVELFGGKIGLRSKKGQGSTFWFTWPVINPVEMYMGELPPDMFSEVQDRSLVLQGAHILLAEDEFINASITKAFLEQAGMQVTLTKNGKEAIKAMENGSFQAILMDVQMPVMDGIEATGEIRKLERIKGASCPIIALTAHAMQGDKERCLQAGMDDYLAKPLDKDQLIEILARYITRKALIVGSDPVNQHDIIQPLVERGWAVTIAETGRLAMYEVSLAHFDMIVVDSSLPLEDGLEMVRTIRKLEQFSGYRASIFGVGLSEKKEQVLYNKCGMDKSFSGSQLHRDFIHQVEELG